MILSKKINLYRNILGYKFVWKETKDNLKRLENEIISFISKYFERDKNTSNLFFYKNNKDITIKINDTNHITLSLIDFSNNELEKTIEKIFEIEKEISNNFKFAFSKKFGYLTPYLKYIPHGFEIEYYITMQYLDMENIKYTTIQNLKDQGYHIVTNSKIIKIIATPTYQEKIKDFISKIQSVINTTEKKEIELFEIFFQNKKTILLDKINKIKGYISNSNLIEYDEAVEILVFLLYFSYIYKNLKKEDISRTFFDLKKSNKISELKQNSKKIKDLIKDL